MELKVIDEADLDLRKKLGEGAFGIVRLGMIRSTLEKVAVKLESQSSDKPCLEHEAHVMKKLQRHQGIPQVFSYGCVEGWNYMVMQLLGQSLASKCQLCGNKFSLPTLLGCAEQMAIALSVVHGAKYVHRDIKPQNFLVGRGNLSTAVYLIDFGLARKSNDCSIYSTCRSNTAHVTGTLPFVSLNVHSGLQHSMRDDLESLAYVLIFFLIGGLPWHGPGNNTVNERETREMKARIDPMDLCLGQPSEFGLLLKYARSLRFEEFPDYAFVLSLFRTIASNLSLSMVIVPDWEIKKPKPTKGKSADELQLPMKKPPNRSIQSLKASMQSTEPHSAGLPVRRSESLSRVSEVARSDTRERLFRGFDGKKIEILGKIRPRVHHPLSIEATSDTDSPPPHPVKSPQSDDSRKCSLF